MTTFEAQALSDPRARPNALAHINFADVQDNSDSGTPSDEDLLEVVEDAQSLLGVSISHAQTRLTSPKTPAIEKAKAIEESGDFFNEQWTGYDSTEIAGEEFVLPEEPRREDEGISRTQSAAEELQTSTVGIPMPADQGKETAPERKGRKEASPSRNKPQASEELRLPSPWRATPRTTWITSSRNEEVKSSLRETFNEYRRRRSVSQNDNSDGQKKLLGFSIPKSPSLFNFTLPNLSQMAGLNQFTNPSSEAPQPRKESHTIAEKITSTDSKDTSTPPFAQIDGQGASRTSDSSFSRPELRRVASDDSRIFRHNLSRASSLGDDTRFENVSGQVNNRLKAFKDSFQDANFKLPTMPNFNFGAGRTDVHARDIHSNSPQSVTPTTSHRTGASKHVPTLVKRVAIGGSEQGSKDASTTAAFAASHPYFMKALEELEGDIVVLGGYRGSILRSAEPPNQQLWAPIKVGLNLRKVNLEVGLNPEDETTMEKRVIPGGMLTHIGPVDISRRLLKRLKTCENAKNGKLRVHNYGYDWRLSPHLLSRKLIEFLERLPSNSPKTPSSRKGAIIVAHSLGGLITRHAINQRPELVAGVVYASVPQTCVNILGPLRNGDDVLLSSRVLTAQVNFTVRTSYALLPLDGKCFIDKNTKEEYPVDFFNVDTWAEYALSPCIARPQPPLNQQPSTGISGLVGAMASVIPSLPILGRRGSISKRDAADKASTAIKTAEASQRAEGTMQGGMAPQMNSQAANSNFEGQSGNPSVSTTVTLPKEDSVAYLRRTLEGVKRFKQELDFNPSYGSQNKYPPIAVVYGKSIPTVVGAKVDGRDGIKRSDAYDELAFASGDGVVLARAAMVPEGYRVVKGGVVASERGHVSLLGDLEAVGRCLTAVIGARATGVGLG